MLTSQYKFVPFPRVSNIYSSANFVTADAFIKANSCHSAYITDTRASFYRATIC